MESDKKINCIQCGRTLLIGELYAANFTLKCKKCGTVNLISVHPQIQIQKVAPTALIAGKVMKVSLPGVKPSVVKNE